MGRALVELGQAEPGIELYGGFDHPEAAICGTDLGLAAGVAALGMRFASVITRDGIEHLIPNEEFSTSKVINWSFSDEAVRIKKPVGVAYGTDVPRAMQAIVEAANTVERVLDKPETRCLLRGFGDNSIDLEVRFWIADPQQGVNNVSSEVLLAIWKAFEAEGIRFPFPQRDVHLDSNGPLRVQIEKTDV